MPVSGMNYNMRQAVHNQTISIAWDDILSGDSQWGAGATEAQQNEWERWGDDGIKMEV